MTYKAFLSTLLLTALLLVGCSKRQASPPPSSEPVTESVPETQSLYTDDAAALLNDYLNACMQESPDSSAVYLLRDHRNPYIPLLSYTVHSQKALNPELWVFSVQQQTQQQICSRPVFVGLINQALYIFPEIEDVPASLCYDFQPASYIVPKDMETSPKETSAAEASAEAPDSAEADAPTEATVPAEVGSISSGTSQSSPAAPGTPSGSGNQSPSSIPTGDHDFKVDVQFNCLTGGVKTYTCRKCGYTFQTDAAPLGEHTFFPGTGSFVQETCTKNGYFLIKCQNCPEYGSFPDPDHPARGHHWVRTLFTDASGTYYADYCDGCKTKDLSSTEYLYHADTFQPGTPEDAIPEANESTDTSQTSPDTAESQN